MPIYEYTCDACGAKFDRLQRAMSGASVEADRPGCPSCASDRTRRSLSLFAVAADTGTSTAAAVDAGPTCGRCGGAPGSCGM